MIMQNDRELIDEIIREHSKTRSFIIGNNWLVALIFAVIGFFSGVFRTEILMNLGLI